MSIPDVMEILNRLEHWKAAGNGKWIARCPAHNDKSPSLSITQRGERILIHCHAGCGANEVLDSIDLDYSVLYPEPADSNYYSSTQPRRSNEPSYDDLLLAITNDSRKSGSKLTKSEKGAEEAAFLRKHRAK